MQAEAIFVSDEATRARAPEAYIHTSRMPDPAGNEAQTQKATGPPFCTKKAPKRAPFLYKKKPGNDLLSHRVTPAVSSAR